MAQALLGVDIGTTNIKAVAFDVNGVQLAKASTPTITHYPKADWAEFDPIELWNMITQVIRGVVEQLDHSHELISVAFTGMAEAGLPLDENGVPLYAAITWYDRRILPQMEEWENKIGQDKTAQITGLPIGPAAGILRLLWLRDNEPEIFVRTRTWLNLPDYAAFKLCGAKVTEYSLASRMMILDLDDREWSADLLNKIDINANMFGKLSQSGVQIGKISQEAATETGLPVNLPVCTGGHDHLCAAIGLGVTTDGEIFDSIGTAEAIVAALPTRNKDTAIADAGIAQGIHILPDRYYAITGNAFGGGSIDWARKLLLSTLEDQNIAFDTLINMAGQTPTGSGGVFFLPHLRQANPPTLDVASRGAFVGLSSDSGPGHMARAVLEGLAYEFQRVLDAVHQNFGISSKRLIASGGGTRNSVFMQIKADISGLPITIPDVEEATCLGAAIAAGIGVDVFDSFEAAYGQFTLSQTTTEPDKLNHDIYSERYQSVYLHMYETLKELNHTISDWVNTGAETGQDE